MLHGFHCDVYLNIRELKLETTVVISRTTWSYKDEKARVFSCFPSAISARFYGYAALSEAEEEASRILVRSSFRFTSAMALQHEVLQ